MEKRKLQRIAYHVTVLEDWNRRFYRRILSYDLALHFLQQDAAQTENSDFNFLTVMHMSLL